MPYVVQLVGVVTGQKTPFDGQYLKYYDPSAHDGVGEIRTTPLAKDALHFDSFKDAMYVYRLSYGTRPDGRPNRPLTAYSVEIKPT